MKIIQILPSIAFGDAVSNDAIAIKKVLSQMGYESRIYAENIHPKMQGQARPYRKMERMRKNDVLIYHNSTGTEMTFDFENFPCRKIMIYHNITPPAFFDGYDNRSKRLTTYGLAATKCIADKMDYCLADSEYNKQDLLGMGYTCPIDVRPVFIPLLDYEKKPSKKILARYGNDGYTNILFVGRISPNKKQEDVIRAFYYYKRNLNRKSRLILVGNHAGMEKYSYKLKNYVDELGLADVIFTGSIPFDEILAYYHLADLFLCMSEHEGFCVPLVEAMYFGVPVLAYASSAVPSTLGGSGVLLKEKDPILAGEMMHRILSDEALRQQVLQKQKERLQDFSFEAVRALFEKQMSAFLEETKR